MEDDRKRKGLPPYMPKRSVDRLDVENASAASARERPNNAGLNDYEMTGLLAEIDDEGDGDCDVQAVLGSRCSLN